MGVYDRVITELFAYNARWFEMHVVDLATWLNNWEGNLLLDIYVEATAEKKVASDMEELAQAVKLSDASYIALEPDTVRTIATDPHYKIMLDMAIAERKERRGRN